MYFCSQVFSMGTTRPQGYQRHYAFHNPAPRLFPGCALPLAWLNLHVGQGPPSYPPNPANSATGGCYRGKQVI